MYIQEVYLNNIYKMRFGIQHNGPAIWGGCFTRRKYRVESRYFSQKVVSVQGGYGTCFCRHGTNFIGYWRGRGTNLLATTFESRCRNMVEGNGAAIAVQVVPEPEICHGTESKLSVDERVRVHEHYEFVSKAGAKAKTVTTCPAKRETTYPYCPCYRALLFLNLG